MTKAILRDGTLVEGVKRFQIRHGLEPDGILGKGTQAGSDGTRDQGKLKDDAVDSTRSAWADR